MKQRLSAKIKLRPLMQIHFTHKEVLPSNFWLAAAVSKMIRRS